jgi:hypothetical protein
MMKLMEPDGQMDSLSFYDDRLEAHLLRPDDVSKPE